jgi:ABC-type amino acid transport substrate-binding protein
MPQPQFLRQFLGLWDKAPTAWHKVKGSLRAERSNLCPNTEIASSLTAPRNDSLISSVPLPVQSFVSRSLCSVEGVNFSFISLLLIVLFLYNSAHADEQNSFRVCFLENNLPYSSNKDTVGFDVDTAKAIAEALGKPLMAVWTKNATQIDEIEESDFPTRKLSRNECDAIFSIPGQDAIKDSPKLAIGAPYYGAAFELIGREQNAPNDLALLRNTPVAIQSQTIANFVLHARKVPIRTFFSTGEAVNGVVSGDATLALLWGPAAGWHLRNHPELKLFFIKGYEPPAVVRWNEHVATRKTDSDLREAIDNALVKINESGVLRELSQRYGMPFHQPFASTYSLAEMQKLH